MKTLFLLLLTLTTLFSGINVTNGKTLILEFDSTKNATLNSKNKTYPLLTHPKDKSKKIAIIPIPYRQKYDIKLNYEDKNILLHVKKGNYKKEQLRVDKSRVTPPKKVLNRIKKEYKEAMKIYHTFNPKREWKEPFIKPMKSKITSQFGNARVFNGKLKSFHSGTDFRAAIGNSVKAINDGVVVLAKDRYYAGGSLIVDHGEGIYSCYYHLSGYKVKVGERVKRGQIVAKSGKSGRVTGPHLHFGLMVQGVQVDPLDFINKINSFILP